MGAEDYLRQRLSQKDLQAISASVHSAYDIRSQVYSICPAGNKVKYRFGAQMINGLVEACLIAATDRGALGLTSREVSNCTGSYHYLHLVSKDLGITVSQTHSKDKLPETCHYRTSHNMGNRLIVPGFEHFFAGPPYAILVHGHASDRPKFVAIGMPEPDYSTWAGQIDLSSVTAFEVEEIIPEKKRFEIRDTAVERLRKVNEGEFME